LVVGCKFFCRNYADLVNCVWLGVSNVVLKVFLLVVVGVFCAQVGWGVVFWGLFLFWVVGLGLFGCCCSCGRVFCMLLVGWSEEVVGLFACGVTLRKSA
jgi:hypothetical protein